MKHIINFILALFIPYILLTPLCSYCVILSLIYWDKKYILYANKLTDDLIYNFVDNHFND